MKHQSNILICIFMSICLSINSQVNKTKLYVRYFVKEKKILFRIAPANKLSFDELKSQSLLIKRTTLINGKENEEIILQKNLMPYSIADTSHWLKLFETDKNKAAFAYQTLYNNNASGTTAEKMKNEKMMLDLLLLSCDLNKEIAKACGLYLADTLAENTKDYIYHFYIYTSPSTTQELETVKIDASELSSDAAIKTLSVKAKTQLALLKWEAKSLEGNFSGYTLERSTDSLNYRPINKAPLLLLTDQFEKNKTEITYTDTMKLTNTTYYYRVKGINFFGETSQPSNVVRAHSYQEIKSWPVIDTITVLQNKRVRLHWQMEDKKENKLPVSYVVMRANADNGPYEIIASLNTAFQYLDLKPNASNYYKIGAVTAYNDTLYSFSRSAMIIDTIAPDIPIGLKATCDKKGQVTVVWHKSKAADVQGYKLFKANLPTEEFIQINNRFITDTSYQFKLNLNTLSKKLYLKISASDKNFNSSLLSDAITLERPDTIAPSAPIILSLMPKQNFVQVKFIKSQSEDVVQHQVFRKSESETNYTQLAILRRKDTASFFTDTNAVLGSGYNYKLVALDSSGNKAESNTPYLKFETGYRQKISNINATVNRDKRTITLNWLYDQNKLEKIIIYRQNKSEPLTILKTLNGPVLSFEDKTPNIGNIYEYRIKAVLQNGTESIISDKIIVEF